MQGKVKGRKGRGGFKKVQGKQKIKKDSRDRMPRESKNVLVKFLAILHKRLEIYK